MLVTSLAHGKALAAKMSKWPWIAFDTETEPLPEFSAGKKGKVGKKAALMWHRAQVIIWSLCHKGESYSFPTSRIDPRFPTMIEWLDVFKPIFTSSSIVKVGHNIKYDHHVVRFEGLCAINNIWDTMIGAWMSQEYLENGLKSRAPLYGRHLLETSTVDFSDLDALAKYAEQDVVQADEMYQMQTKGFITRQKTVSHLLASGKTQGISEGLPAGRIVVDKEGLTPFEQAFLILQELPVLKATIRAEDVGICLDTAKLGIIRAKLNNQLTKVQARFTAQAGRAINLRSSKQLLQLFKDKNIEVPFTNKKGAPTLNAHALFRMSGSHPLIDLLAEYRKLSKLQSVYVGDQDSDDPEDWGLEYFVHPSDKRIHCSNKTMGAVTGRGTCQLPNMHQIPSRADTFGIKETLVAPRGMKIICLDYAQVEIRYMCLMCKDPEMTRILSDPKGDIHQNTADRFHVARNPTAKNLNFLLLYGGGAYMLAENLTNVGVPTSKTEAGAFIRVYDEDVHPKVKEYRQFLVEHHRRFGFVYYITGRTRHLPDIDWEDYRILHKAETTLSNNIIQGSAQDGLKAFIVRADPLCINPDLAALTMLQYDPKTKHRAKVNDYASALPRIRATFAKAKLQYLLQVHDECLFCVDERAAEDMLHMLASLMTWKTFFQPITDYHIPIVAEGGVGDNWAHAKSKNPLFHATAGFEEFQKDKILI